MAAGKQADEKLFDNIGLADDDLRQFFIDPIAAAADLLHDLLLQQILIKFYCHALSLSFVTNGSWRKSRY